MNDLFERLPEAVRRLVRRSPPPREVRPMKATLTDRRFSDPAWLYERKLDGERCVTFRTPTGVRLASRSDHAISSTYPEAAAAVAAARGQFVVDGELCAFDGDATSFSRLQTRMGVVDPEPELVERVPIVLCLFDLLHLDGYDTTGLPLWARKELLAGLLDFSGALRYVPHRGGDGEVYYRQACAAGWEGLIAKRADSPYLPRRSSDWLKFKCLRGQEFVVGGWTDPTGSRQHLGALLVGYYDGDRLRYAGRVGTGFDRPTLRRLRTLLDPLAADRSPFVDATGMPKGAHWVRPELVAEIGFAEWTRDGRLRHPRYQGLRDDKTPRQVVREVPT